MEMKIKLRFHLFLVPVVVVKKTNAVQYIGKNFYILLLEM